MKLSVIIVNYNVKYFLEQCLQSVIVASKNIESEIFVVDNNSVDGSVQMLNNNFPDINVIANKENVGFSKANNQAIKSAKGEYILLLNPDTIVEPDTFEKCIDYMDKHPDTGGLGVKMIDGKGKFLPESKRGFPTPMVAFYKIFGLSALFPKSKRIGKYHLGYLSEDDINNVEVLAGAFMLIRKTVIDKIGLLDEDYFMYGEDIDYSYRIIKAGFKNVYFPKTRIIHYKGESTKKSSINYVFMFYKAMIIFAQKHFSQKNARLFSVLINLAIYLRASLSIFKRFLNRIIIPLIDFVIIWAGMYFLQNFWSHEYLSADFEYYPKEYILYIIPIYIFLWLSSFYFIGGYDKPYKISRIFQGIAYGTIVILVIYSLLDSSYRFSRAIIILGAVWSIFSLLIIRIVLHFIPGKSFRLNISENKRFAIVGDKDETLRVAELLRNTNINPGFIGLVDIDSNNKSENVIGNITQLKDIIDIYNINEVIFCAQSITANEIINYMSQLNDKSIDYKIVPPKSMYFIGSNSINTTADLYVIDINGITKPVNKRNKRLFDFISALFFILLLPFFIVIQKKPINFLKNLILVLFAGKTWVGFHNIESNNKTKIPKIKKGVLSCCSLVSNDKLNDETIHKLNLLYSRDYNIQNDIKIILKNIRNLGS
jgi:GT2 family glycosyltransferase